MATTEPVTGQPTWERRINDDGTHVLTATITLPNATTDKLEFVADRRVD